MFMEDLWECREVAVGGIACLDLRGRCTCARRRDSPDAEKAKGVCLLEPI
jgi:hypothetical protein